MKGRDFLQDFIPDVGQLEFAQVATEGWVINPYEHGLLEGPGNDMDLSAHNGETVHIDAMPWDATMFIDGGGALWLSLSLTPKFYQNSAMYSS